MDSPTPPETAAEASETLRIFGIPMDLGQARRGVDMGPSAMRYAGLQERLERLGLSVHDEGNIRVPEAEQYPEDMNPPTINAHFLPQVSRVLRATYEQITGCLHPQDRAVFVGGDHSISIATVAAVTAQEKVGVLWIDAHADINTPATSPSGNIHGMSMAALLGEGPTELTDIGQPGPKLSEAAVAMIAVRDLDPPERARLAHSAIQVHTIRAVDEQGIDAVARRMLAQFARFEHIHVSLDLDCCDPRIAPGVGTPVPGGLSYREAHLLMEILADSGKVRTMDVVEINPILDDRNSTAEIAVELIASLFGQRII